MFAEVKLQIYQTNETLINQYQLLLHLQDCSQDVS